MALIGKSRWDNKKSKANQAKNSCFLNLGWAFEHERVKLQKHAKEPRSWLGKPNINEMCDVMSVCWFLCNHAILLLLVKYQSVWWFVLSPIFYLSRKACPPPSHFYLNSSVEKRDSQGLWDCLIHGCSSWLPSRDRGPYFQNWERKKSRCFSPVKSKPWQCSSLYPP